MPKPVQISEQPLAFGGFQLFRERKILLEDLRPVRIGSRALELLIALVERAGEIVGKNELMAYVWPDTVVEENNLRVHIAALRKLLGDGQGGARFILNVAGRGYSFVAPVTRLSDSRAVRPPMQPSGALPVALTRVVGREPVIRSVLSLVQKRRLISIIGPAGIGKTTVALAVADRVTGDGQLRVCFADLATISDPLLVVSVIADATGVAAATEDPLGMLAGSLRDAHLLLLLDNCEHVIETVAKVVERLLRAAPGITIVATSRERLMADGEHVLSLGPLEFPPASRNITAEQALQFPAVQLFVERAVNALDTFRIDDSNATLIAGICQRLDGIPLAVELVAARVSTLGLEVLGESLDQSLLVLSKGRRTANGRHQSLSATLQWSYRLLSPAEQMVLRRLATFSGSFTSEAALAVAADVDVTADEVHGALMVLAQRSLLITEVGGAEVRYRLLYVTRMFAVAQLESCDEAASTRRRHAAYHLTIMEAAAESWEKLDRTGWLQRHGAELEDLRAALHWCFGAGGDIHIGAPLFVASLPFGVQLSLHDFERRAHLTLEVLRKQGPQLLAELQVHTALASLMLQLGGREESLHLHVGRMQALADRTGLIKLMVEPMAARAVVALERVDFAEAIRQVDILQEISRGADDAFAVLVADRVSAQVFHWAGDHARARPRAERVLRHPARSIPLAYGATAVDRRVSMRVVLARIAWLEGRGEEAQQICDEALEYAQADAPGSVCQTLAFASCPVALWRGDRARARAAIDALLECAQRYQFMRWYRMALCFQQALEPSMPRGEARDPGSASTVDGKPLSLLCQDLLATIGARWFHIDMTARATSGRAGWCTAELLRLTGDRLLDVAQAEEREAAARGAELRYLEALQCARAQQALAWELRAATSLARVRLHTGEPETALEALESLCERFLATDQSADVLAARQLLAGQGLPRRIHSIG